MTTAAAPEPLRARVRRAGLVVFGGAAAVLALSSGLAPCPFAAALGVPCPGCGSTRSVVALLHGDLEGVVRYNPFGPVVAVLVGILALRAGVAFIGRGDIGRVEGGRSGRVLVRALMVVAILEVALWVARFFGAFGGPVPVGTRAFGLLPWG